MPYINIQITNERVSKEQKQLLIKGATELMVDVLGKDPSTTFVVIQEFNTDNWGLGGISISEMHMERREKLENQ